MTEKIMNPDDLLRKDDVLGALNALKQRVCDKPEDVKLRIFLFQVFSVLGEYGKAFNQLNVLAELDALTIPMVQSYKTLLPSEAFRTEVFKGQHMPPVFMPAQHSEDKEQQKQSQQTDTSKDYMHPLLLSLQQQCAGEMDAALALNKQAMAAAPTLAGSINGEEFSWIMDGDSRIGPALEVVIKGKYYWVPFEKICHIGFEAPQDLRDMIWFPAQFTWDNQDQAIGFIPVRYPDTLAHEDSRFWLSKQTDWQSPAESYFTGIGQRSLMTDSKEYSLLDIRELTIAPSATETA